jgi:hypothetical protein
MPFSVVGNFTEGIGLVVFLRLKVKKVLNVLHGHTGDAQYP